MTNFKIQGEQDHPGPLPTHMIAMSTSNVARARGTQILFNI